MITLIDLIDDKTDTQQIYLPSLAESIMTSIWSILRKNWTLHKYNINHLERQTSPSNYSLKFSLTTIHKGVFKIFTVVHISLAYLIKMNIHSNIGSDRRQITKVFPELQYFIMELKTRKKASPNFFNFVLQQNAICTTESSSHNINVSPRQFAKTVFEKFEYSESLCEKMVGQLTKKQKYEFSGFLNKKEEKAVTVCKDFALAEKENQRFKEFYRQEKNGQSVLKNPKIIGKKGHQIVRSLRFNQNIPVNQIALSSYDKNRYKGGYSELYYIKHRAGIQNTIQQHRNPRYEVPQNRPARHYENQKTCIIVKKVPTRNINRRIHAERSIMNENYFLTNILSNEDSPFICNYYFNLDIPSYPLQPIYSDFHRQSVSEIFFTDERFTMLDILNFTEQLVIALITQYLDKGFLHRDIKSGNILLNRRVIQIIDHGSVYPFNNPIKIQAIQKHKDHLDSELRTTYRIQQIEFYKSRRLMAKYDNNFSNFEKLNCRHRTFDVYAAGRMLKEIIQTYQSTFSPKWMEISVTWHRLIEKMTQKDFQIRIQMENVLQEVRNIRAKIFGIDQNHNL